MANNSQGISVSLGDGFGDYDFQEVVSVSVDGVQADTVEMTARTSQSRVKAFRPADKDYGTLSVTFRAEGNVALKGYVGYTTNVTVSQGSTSLWNSGSTLQSFAWRASVGELQEYVAVFKLGAIQ